VSATARVDLLEQAVDGLAHGALPAGIFNDAGIFELERERIFARSWVYVAHESELPQPGDYVVRAIVDEPLVVVRDEAGEVRVLLNRCRHKGMQICRSEAGNASHFRCPYHGWTYRNDGALIGVPVQKAAYGDGLDKERLGLHRVRAASYDGLVFATLSDETPPLEEWLGDVRWYLDLWTKRSPAGLEVVGPPQRWVVDADWKIVSENFTGDSYHTLMTHRSMVELGQAPSDPKYAMYGEQVHIPGRGHGVMLIAAPPGAPLPPFWGYPEEMRERARSSYPTEAQFQVADRTRIMLGTVFPNFSAHNPIRRPHHRYDGHVPMLTFRVWNPLGPGRIEVYSWFLVERDAPEEFKRLSALSYLRSFGSSGTFEQDDTEIWTLITRGGGTLLGRTRTLDYSMGGELAVDAEWPGPGVAQAATFSDASLRNFYTRWLELLTA
jgi:phenylpropionate dioxygenase-like ring-hydroxylating dioxygenase large terminal subunit